MFISVSSVPSWFSPVKVAEIFVSPWTSRFSGMLSMLTWSFMTWRSLVEASYVCVCIPFVSCIVRFASASAASAENASPYVFGSVLFGFTFERLAFSA